MGAAVPGCSSTESHRWVVPTAQTPNVLYAGVCYLNQFVTSSCKFNVLS